MHETGHIKLTDFDLSKGSQQPTNPQVVREMFGGDIKKVSTVPDLVTNSFVGTAEYIAPEVISGFGHSSAVDWWTFGILIYEMLFGRAPFQGTNRDEIFKKIMDEKLKFPEDVAVSKEAKKLMRALLTPDAKKRLGAEHGAADIKAHPFFASINWALVADMKPPMIPRLIDPEHEAGKQGAADDEQAQGSLDGGSHKAPPETKQDPFKDFEHVSKPEEPSELHLMRLDKMNNENES